MSTKQKSFLRMDKWTKRGAIVGGIWGLVTGILYAWGVFAAGFSGHGDVGILFKNVPVIWKIIYLPTYLTDMISNLLGNLLIIMASLLGFSFFIIWCIGIPILFGVAIGILVTAIVKIGVRK